MIVCPLTGRSVNPGMLADQAAFCYETLETGTICFTDQGFNAVHNLPAEQKYLLAGIFRNKKEKTDPPKLVTSQFVREIMQQNIPYAFEAKARHLLKVLYDQGAKDYKSFNYRANSDSSIAYATPEEFCRILKFMKSEAWIDYNEAFLSKTFLFDEIRVTKSGIAEVEKGLPKMPMFGLVSQEISTGDLSIDSTIEQARKSFFNEPSSFESKRSACETLSFVIEPFRQELKGMFDSDTEDFFNIVNNFNVRHNKKLTKQIKNEEQLEWIFYSLLNTINTYVKMKRRVK